MAHFIFFILFLLTGRAVYVNGIRFSAESFAEISLLSQKGKTHLDSLREKANVPQFGSCWKNAISNLQIGCKFLSENVQSDLALAFTDCFLQMSGHEPLNCDRPRSACLKKLSDRAFNAYTEFYTHTQSICYFLQSQVWHEETEKTINKLSVTSQEVSKKLGEASEVQEKLLDEQQKSLLLQYDINNSSKNVASAMQQSQDKINGFINDVKHAAAEQKELLVEVFENLILFRTWAVNELSWFNSTIYFAAATLMSFLFTSVSRTREVRMIILIIFAVNYFFERVLSSSVNGTLFGSYIIITQDSLNSYIWLCRNFCVCLAVVILLYNAINFCDYNLCNYRLLLEIKKQNIKILNQFDLLSKNQSSVLKNDMSEINSAFNQFSNNQKHWNASTSVYTIQENSPHFLNKNSHLNHYGSAKSNSFSRDLVDAEEKTVINEDESADEKTSESGDFSKLNISHYNLRSNKRRTINF